MSTREASPAPSQDNLQAVEQLTDAVDGRRQAPDGGHRRPRKRARRDSEPRKARTKAEFFALFDERHYDPRKVKLDDAEKAAAGRQPGMSMPLHEGERACKRCIKEDKHCERPIFVAGSHSSAGAAKCIHCLSVKRACEFTLQRAPAGDDTCKYTAEEVAAAVAAAPGKKTAVIREHVAVRDLYDGFDWAHRGPNGTRGIFDRLPTVILAEERAELATREANRRRLEVLAGDEGRIKRMELEIAQLQATLEQTKAETRKNMSEAHMLDSETVANALAIASQFTSPEVKQYTVESLNRAGLGGLAADAVHSSARPASLTELDRPAIDTHPHGSRQ